MKFSLIPYQKSLRLLLWNLKNVKNQLLNLHYITTSKFVESSQMDENIEIIMENDSDCEYF